MIGEGWNESPFLVQQNSLVVETKISRGTWNCVGGRLAGGNRKYLTENLTSCDSHWEFH